MPEIKKIALCTARAPAPLTCPNKKRIKKITKFIFLNRFWYKTKDDAHPNIHIVRVFASDPEVIKYWSKLEQVCRTWTETMFEPHLRLHIEHLLSGLGYSAEQGKGGPLPTQVLSKAQVDSLVQC